MILSVLWTEIICIQAQTKICHHTLILMLHYLAKINTSVQKNVTTEPFNKQSKTENIFGCRLTR